MDWMNEMGEMIAVDAPEREAKFEEMIDSQIREIREACPCYSAGTDSAIVALLTGKCPICRE